MMIVYEVVAEVVMARAAEWQAWIVPHMQQVVDTGCFERASLERIVDPAVERAVFRVRYVAPAMADVERYIEHHAPALRAEGLDRFGGDAITRRTLAEEIL